MHLGFRALGVERIGHDRAAPRFVFRPLRSRNKAAANLGRVAYRLASLVATTLLATGLGFATVAATEPVDPAPATTDAAPTTDNAFFPDDTTTNVTDCVSALPRPECGSKERGGWRQGVVFGVVVAGLVAVGARLVIGIRRRDRDGHTATDDT
jgi:hypothetical protein